MTARTQEEHEQQAEAMVIGMMAASIAAGITANNGIQPNPVPCVRYARQLLAEAKRQTAAHGAVQP